MKTLLAIAGWVGACFVVLLIGYFSQLGKRVKELEGRIGAVEWELRPLDPRQTWHYLVSGGRRCGNSDTSALATAIGSHVTCEDCRRLMAVSGQSGLRRTSRDRTN